MKQIGHPVEFELPDCFNKWKDTPYTVIRRSILFTQTEKCGEGIVADEDIKHGEFVIEYVGEVIDDKTCEERLWNMKHRGETNFYLCEINRDMVIDATYKGNKSRYINHSCCPNTEMQKWIIDGETRIGIFAMRDIKKGEHLTYDYQYECLPYSLPPLVFVPLTFVVLVQSNKFSRFVQFGADQDCHCGAAGCRQKLGVKPSKSKMSSDATLKLVACQVAVSSPTLKAVLFGNEAAIETWVTEYCSFYYPSDETVKNDTEIQSWWSEVKNEGHGDLRKEPWWPEMNTLADLTQACTIIIWIASAFHAAINFGQYLYAGYLSNRPTVSRRFMPKPGTKEYDELENNPDLAFLKTITAQFQALLGVSLIKGLSRHATNEIYLGQRDTAEWTTDDEPLAAFERFGKKLVEIGSRITERTNDSKLKNRVGPVKVPYTLLYPNTSDYSREGGLIGKGIPNNVLGPDTVYTESYKSHSWLKIFSYFGIIKRFDKYSKKHLVMFEDGDVEFLDLSKEDWELITL
ncbi:hypothetical protein Gotri_006478 [Gossypium trilobum]|uniref:SET domain-containing protein n=1 Tax=Gossypium trilobum TaxID=34281 RepID=A0A7J9F059_9ROSI|nr:hypothetical protein [Gossypium trilobum]